MTLYPSALFFSNPPRRSVKQKNLPFNQRYKIFKSRVKKVHADCQGKDPLID